MLLTAVGVLLWFLPGPGWLFVVLGLALVAAQSMTVARALDWSEVKIRERVRSLWSWWRTAAS